MASLRGGRNRKLKAEINVVPYIDVMLVLLVIFMVVAPMTNPSVINLPNAGQSIHPPSDYIQILLRPDAPAQIGITSKQASHREEMVTTAGREQLLKQLKQFHEDRAELPVLIAADKDMKYDDVIQLIGEAKKLGIERVGLATK